MNEKTLILAAAGVAALLWGASATAQEAGRVLFSKGDVRILAPDGTSRPAVKGDPIRPGEKLVTGPGALGQVKLPEGGRLSLRPDSEIGIGARQGPGPRELTLGKGNVRALTAVLPGAGGPAPDPAGGLVLRTPGGGEVQLDRTDAIAALRPQDPGALVRVNEGTATARGATGVPLVLGREQGVSFAPGGVQRLSPAALQAVSGPALEASPRAVASAPRALALTSAPGAPALPAGRFVQPGSPALARVTRAPGPVSAAPVRLPAVQTKPPVRLPSAVRGVVPVSDVPVRTAAEATRAFALLPSLVRGSAMTPTRPTGASATLQRAGVVATVNRDQIGTQVLSDPRTGLVGSVDLGRGQTFTTRRIDSTTTTIRPTLGSFRLR